jgi:hypothetical protein
VRKVVKWVGLAVALVLVAGGLGFFARLEMMKRAWIRFDRYDIRSAGILQVGDLAPDLELEIADGSGSVRLSDLYHERPVVLVFGSYT